MSYYATSAVAPKSRAIEKISSKAPSGRHRCEQKSSLAGRRPCPSARAGRAEEINDKSRKSTAPP
jgi:hypothetical protein